MQLAMRHHTDHPKNAALVTLVREGNDGSITTSVAGLSYLPDLTISRVKHNMNQRYHQKWYFNTFIPLALRNAKLVPGLQKGWWTGDALVPSYRWTTSDGNHENKSKIGNFGEQLMGKPMSVSISGPEAILTQEKKNSNIPKMTEPDYFS